MQTIFGLQIDAAIANGLSPMYNRLNSIVAELYDSNIGLYQGKFMMKSQHFWGCAGLLALTCLLAPMTWAQDASTTSAPPIVTPTLKTLATVQNVTGQLEVQRPGGAGSGSLLAPAALFNGDIANTNADSKANLLFSEGTQVLVNSGSIVQLDSSVRVSGGRRSFFRIIRGEVLVRARSPLAVLTPGGTAAVRGTVFDIIVDAQGITTLTVLEGVVDFFNTAGKVSVRQLQSSVARSGDIPTRAMPTAQGPLITQWTSDFNPGQLNGAAAQGSAGQVIGQIVSIPKPHRGIFNTLVSAVITAAIAGIVSNNLNDSPNDNFTTREETTSPPLNPTGP